jgi:hypothetical protein
VFIASGIPYAPHMFEITVNNVTIVNGTDQLAALDMSRVGCYIQIVGAAFPAGAFFTANSTGLNAVRLTGTSVLGIELWWEKYYTLCGSGIWINGAGIGNVFSVTEVRINQSSIGEIDNATRKPESLADKIKNFIQYKRYGNSR